MPSANDLYVYSLLHPIVGGEEKSPTIVSILLILLTKVIKSHELPPPRRDEETDCVVCQHSLRHSEKKELLVLSCGHILHRVCVEQWLIDPREHLYPVYAEHVEIDQPVRVLQSFKNVEPIWDKIDLPRNCPICRHRIIPTASEGYNMSQYEDGIAPEEAQHILDYFAHPKHGEQRKARLNNGATLGSELQAAHDHARNVYTGEFGTMQEEKETADFFARGDRLMEQRDADDSDYSPPKRKKVKPSRPRSENTKYPRKHIAALSQHQSHQRPPPVYIDLTKDSDDDIKMDDADGPSAATKPSSKPSTKLSITLDDHSNRKRVFKGRTTMTRPNYLNGRRTDPLTVWRGPRSRDWFRSHVQRSMLRRSGKITR